MAKAKTSKSKQVTKANKRAKSSTPAAARKPNVNPAVVTPSADATPKRAISRLRLRSPFRGYFIESWREIRRVKWPKRREAWKLTFAVIVFSVVFAAALATLDFLFEKLAKVIFLR